MPNVTLQIAKRIATITFDRGGSSANLFDRATLDELAAILRTVEAKHDLDGVLLRSAKPGIFIAGADLNALQSADESDLRDLIELGQQTFNLLDDLRVPTVAAIHGACAGGGLEVALACDWRVASDDPRTKIGLPETQLGILPAWGGTTRLPALIGLPKALAAILSGKLHAAKEARAKGLVDAVVPSQHLESHALTLLQRGRRKPRIRPFAHHRIGASLIHRKARKSLLEKTRGHYPAPEAALDVACASVTRTRQESLDAERDAFTRLAGLGETKQLIRLFFLTERAKKHRHVETPPGIVRTAAVIGSGVMGSGIAYWLSTRGIPVILQDVDHAAIARGMNSIANLYSQARKRRVFTPTEAARGIDRIHPAADKVPLHRCDMVIEAAVEDLEIKKKIFADLAERTAPGTILATNTSALPIHELASVIDHPGRLIGIHFFNPVHRMRLVEVVRTATTSDQTLATGVAFVRSLGKIPVVVRDSPGFLVNRILMPYLVEAANLFQSGASIESIDRAMLAFGMPMGPLRLLDEVGLDVSLHVARTLAAAYPDRMRVPDLLERMVDKGLLGRKSGTGFYQHKHGKTRPASEPLALRGTPAAPPADIANHLAAMMARETRLCLDEGVANNADDIDLAMILGTGYPPFRGGPMQFPLEPETTP